jgi:hypothetical protein
MESFEKFFRRATGWPPYGFQMKLARDGLPAVVQAPTGAGKTGIVLAWRWRRLHGPDPITPARPHPPVRTPAGSADGMMHPR